MGITVAVAEVRCPRSRTDGLVVGMVGRIAPWKGQDLLLRAFASAFPCGDARAVIVGAPLFGPAVEAFARQLPGLASALGIADRVDFRGHHDDVAPDLLDFDVLVHASRGPEPFGQAVVEGMAAGLPVIAGDTGGPAEVITDGHDGILYRTDDFVALSASLVRTGGDAELRARIGSQAQRSAAAYGPREIVPKLMGVYRSILDAGPAAS